jgi:hypothetical protein
VVERAGGENIWRLWAVAGGVGEGVEAFIESSAPSSEGWAGGWRVEVGGVEAGVKEVMPSCWRCASLPLFAFRNGPPV